VDRHISLFTIFCLIFKLYMPVTTWFFFIDSSTSDAINWFHLNQHLATYFTYHFTPYSPTRFGALRRRLQEVSYVTVRFSAHHLDVNICPNVLVKCGLLTDALFFKILRRSLVTFLGEWLHPVDAPKTEQLNMRLPEDGADMRRNA